ncbi:MAG TPA: glutathione S-transferase family protein [Solirubrobacteraceae bacterium]|jgi:glutathione S-transferase|nr:glutathione S-transferase family protein [Solirubrobacteraceae bacterium]
MLVLGSEISYFTGKFETYLRYKEIPYTYRGLDLVHYYWIVPRRLGATQYPTVRLPDGRWMSDTTPMIAWLERQYPDRPVLPAEPLQRYVALLIEDFADEWLWRPAMYYRWSHADDRRLAAASLAREVVRLPLPLALRKVIVARRQTHLFVTHDGVDDPATREHAGAAYRRVLAMLEPTFVIRPFILGERPTIADVGLMGPFWRHFAHDPTTAKLMQDNAPSTFAWAARVWSARASRIGDRELLEGIPADLSPLLTEIGETHLEALSANAAAHAAGRATHNLTVQGVTYRKLPTSTYRVWCLEQLRARFAELDAAVAAQVRALLERHRCWEPLWRIDGVRSGHDPDGTAPFCQATRMVRDADRIVR